MSDAAPSRKAVGSTIAIVLWLAALAIAIVVIAHARFTADLSAFLPTRPTPEQALLIEQLREGPASQLVLVAIEGDGARPVDDATLARLSKAVAATLRGDARFLSVNDGESVRTDADHALFLEHRYLLSDRVTPARFTVDGLHGALTDSLDLLSSSAGMMLQPLIRRDPTAELLHLVDTLTGGRELPTVDGVWIATDAVGRHALLVVETRTAGSDIDGQQVAVDALHAAFDGARSSAGPAAGSARLLLSGLPVFAVDARRTIEHEAALLSTIGLVLVAALLLFVYRSIRALALGLVPMASGALCGLAVVATGFGVVHGITLGFGVTLIGEAVDYAIYLFVQRPDLRSRDGSGVHGSGVHSSRFWKTIALGVGTSVIGFGALLLSGFDGLAQIGLLSIVGLVVAASVTRWVLPALMPAGFAVRPLPGLAQRLRRAFDSAQRLRVAVLVVAALACIVVTARRNDLWSHELSSLSTFSKAQGDLDQRLRGELGAPDVRDLVVIRAASEEGALLGSEAVAAALAPLVADGALAGVEAPSRYLPSEATQRRRQAALPDDATLRRDFARALDGLPFNKSGFEGFFDDVARERSGGLLHAADLAGTSIAPALRALLAVHPDEAGRPRWTAVVALRSPPAASDAASAATRARIVRAIDGFQAAGGPTMIRYVDIKSETEGLYAGYLSVAVRMAGIGALAIVALLAVGLKRRVGVGTHFQFRVGQEPEAGDAILHGGERHGEAPQTQDAGRRQRIIRGDVELAAAHEWRRRCCAGVARTGQQDRARQRAGAVEVEADGVGSRDEDRCRLFSVDLPGGGAAVGGIGYIDLVIGHGCFQWRVGWYPSSRRSATRSGSASMNLTG